MICTKTNNFKNMDTKQIYFDSYVAPEVHIVSVESLGILCQSDKENYESSNIEDVTRESFIW